jgi:hypothetical protein
MPTKCLLPKTVHAHRPTETNEAAHHQIRLKTWPSSFHSQRARNINYEIAGTTCSDQTSSEPCANGCANALAINVALSCNPSSRRRCAAQVKLMRPRSASQNIFNPSPGTISPTTQQAINRSFRAESKSHYEGTRIELIAQIEIHVPRILNKFSEGMVCKLRWNAYCWPPGFLLAWVL